MQISTIGIDLAKTVFHIHIDIFRDFFLDASCKVRRNAAAFLRAVCPP